MKTAWCIIGFAVIVEAVALWIYYPAELRDWLFANYTTSNEVTIKLEPIGFVWTVLAASLLCLFIKDRSWRLLGAGLWSYGKTFGVAIGLIVAMRLALGMYVLLVPGARESLGTGTGFTVEIAGEMLRAIGPLGLIATIAVLVPFLEEILFRGVLLGALAKHIPFWSANTIQALCFALAHANIWLLPYFFGMAIIAGELVRRSHSLLPAIALHAANNLIACGTVVFMSSQGKL